MDSMATINKGPTPETTPTGEAVVEVGVAAAIPTITTKLRSGTIRTRGQVAAIMVGGAVGRASGPAEAPLCTSRRPLASEVTHSGAVVEIRTSRGRGKTSHSTLRPSWTTLAICSHPISESKTLTIS